MSPAEGRSSESGGKRPRLGRYELIAGLGHGGMADVYLALSRGPAGFNKLIVVKRLRAELAGDEAYRAMFLDEANLAARLNHPNVVATFEVGEQGQVIYIAMEYLEGQPLHIVVREAAKQGKPLSVTLCARIIADALAGLHYAHELKDYDGTPLEIVHRDVSPHNVFLTYDGQVKVVDFGVAKAQSRATETEVGVVKGKVAYMAPEQLAGPRVDRRADVFAMGIVFWEILTGQKLMARESAIATMHRLLNDPIDPPSDLVPDLDREIDAIVRQALEREPANRFATASDMRQALEAHLRAHGSLKDELAGVMQSMFTETRERLQAEIQRCLTEQPASTGEITALRTSGGDGLDATPSHQSMRDVPSGVHTSHSVRADATATTDPAATRVEAVAVVHGARPPVPAAGAHPSWRWRWLAAGGVGLLGVGGFLAVRPRHGESSIRGSDSVVVARPSFEPVLRLHGSNTIGAELAPALAEAFLRRQGATDLTRRPGNTPLAVDVVGSLGGKSQGISVDAEGSGTAFEDLGKGACDVGMASRAIKASEVEALARLGDLTLPGSEHVLGLDGIAVLVHPNNPLRAIDTAALRSVFAGRTRDWSELAIRPGPIVLSARDDRSGTTDVFKQLVLGDEGLAATAKRFEDNAAVAQDVAGDPNAIGFAGFRSVGGAKALAVSEPGSAALYPSAFTIATEEYVLTRRLYLYTKARPETPAAMDFVNFALSVEGQKVVRDVGFVDLTVRVSDAPACTGQCPRPYALATKHARRLSLNFHFRPGSSELDTRSLRDIDRVLDFLKAYPTPHVLLLGFSDASDPSQSAAISKERAKKVDLELTARGVRATLVDGFGQEMPIASNATPAGRERNRRVEVWLDKE